MLLPVAGSVPPNYFFWLFSLDPLGRVAFFCLLIYHIFDVSGIRSRYFLKAGLIQEEQI